MKLEDYRNWNEVISENEFSHYLTELYKNKDVLSREIFLEILEILGDKYSKFYGTLKLTNVEKESINLTLLEFTNFYDLRLMEELIGRMFDFRLDYYYYYLKKNVNSIKLDEIKNEVLNALKEYEEGEIEESR